MILHITTKDQWNEAKVNGDYTTPSLKLEGFIHCSTIRQAVDTANIFFRNQQGLILLCIDETKLKSECRYEAPAGGGLHDPKADTLFPHIYGPINISAVKKIVDFPIGKDGLFALPDELKTEQ